MELKTKIMFCGVNNLTDARYAAAIGSEWLGFDFDPASPVFVDPDKAAVIKGWLSGPFYFGEFAEGQIKHIVDIQEKLQLDYVYIKGYPDVQNLAGLPVPVIMEIAIDGMDDDQVREAFVTYSRHAKLFVVRSESDTLEKIPGELCKTYPIFLRFNFSAETAIEALEACKIEGLCLSGDHEDKTGIRDFEELQRIVDALTIE